MIFRPRLILLLFVPLLGGLLGPAATAAVSPVPVQGADRASDDPVGETVERRTERFSYRWELKGLAAFLGRILLPGEGRGRLTFEPQGDGRLLARLVITSEHSREGEYYRYGAEIDVEDGRTIEAWSSYVWRGEKSSERSTIEQEGVIDVASGIFRIRRTMPEEPLELRIWSDGRIYPVLVRNLGAGTRTLPGGRRVLARHYRVEGRDVPGERHWKGHMDLWFARDEATTPIEIQFDRALIGVRLRLVDE